jgi:hypothetical protein
MNKNGNVWHYKPWWCQPWSILLTGITIIGGSWVISHRIWLGILVAIPVLIWWVYFLLIYPRLFAEEIEKIQP